jgi:hypothetical protein|nr:MAG TPA: hypothetical protein [Caudoviricetes sp.]
MHKILLKNRSERPPFSFYVRENTENYDYYAFDDLNEAMAKARILSLTKYPVVMVMEPWKTKYGEWRMKRTFWYIQGKCREDEAVLLHAKFYTDAGECLNQKSGGSYVC